MTVGERVVFHRVGGGTVRVLALGWPFIGLRHFFFFITLDAGPGRPLSLELSDTKVHEPFIRARTGTARIDEGGALVS